MPMYEFRCQTCHAVFEELCKMDESGDELRCPACKGVGATRLVSVFAAHGLENGHHGVGKRWGGSSCSGSSSSSSSGSSGGG